LVEDKANGSAVISTLQHEISGLVPVNPAGGKVARAHAVTPAVESGNVFVPHPRIAPWVDGYLAEMSVFPAGAHDDRVDMTTQALNRLTEGGGGMFQLWREQAESIKARQALEKERCLTLREQHLAAKHEAETYTAWIPSPKNEEPPAESEGAARGCPECGRAGIWEGSSAWECRGCGAWGRQKFGLKSE
jgi:hypothetical protein